LGHPQNLDVAASSLFLGFWALVRGTFNIYLIALFQTLPVGAVLVTKDSVDWSLDLFCIQVTYTT